MMPGQHRAGEVVEAPRTRLAAIALPMRLGVIAPVSGNREAVTPGTAYAIGPAMLAHQGEALGVVQKTREVNQIGCNHDDEAPRASRTAARASAITSDALRTRYPDPPPRNPIRAARFFSGQTSIGFCPNHPILCTVTTVSSVEADPRNSMSNLRPQRRVR